MYGFMGLGFRGLGFRVRVEGRRGTLNPKPQNQVYMARTIPAGLLMLQDLRRHVGQSSLEASVSTRLPKNKGLGFRV